VLLVERGREPLKGFWSIPGGLVETGESLEDATRREVLEETGLVVRPIRIAKVFERIIRDPDGKAEYHYVLIDYLCEATGGILAAADDASRVEWFPRINLPGLRFTEGTLAVIGEAWALS